MILLLVKLTLPKYMSRCEEMMLFTYSSQYAFVCFLFELLGFIYFSL